LKFRLFPGEVASWVDPALEILFLAAFLAFYLLFLNTLNRLFRHVLKSGGETMDKKGQTLLNLWMFVASTASGALFLAGAAPFISIWSILVAVAGMVIYLGGGLKRTLAPMDSQLDSFVDQVVRSASGAASDRATLKNLLQDRYPLSAVVQDFMLPTVPTAANRTLADLRLRKETGATVVSVYRGELCLTNPSPDFRILPGDVLCLLGEKEHVQSAFGYLKDLCRRPPDEDSPVEAPHLETALLPVGSPLVGRSLENISLRTRTGATVVGLEREGALNTSPSPNEPLKAGDMLLLLGGSDAVSRAQRMVATGDLGSAALSEAELTEQAVLRG
jgi:K+/H+ antiporter YhaU regulatory subunit KhtT